MAINFKKRIIITSCAQWLVHSHRIPLWWSTFLRKSKEKQELIHQAKLSTFAQEVPRSSASHFICLKGKNTGRMKLDEFVSPTVIAILLGPHSPMNHFCILPGLTVFCHWSSKQTSFWNFPYNFLWRLAHTSLKSVEVPSWPSLKNAVFEGGSCFLL